MGGTGTGDSIRQLWTAHVCLLANPYCELAHPVPVLMPALSTSCSAGSAYPTSGGVYFWSYQLGGAQHIPAAGAAAAAAQQQQAAAAQQQAVSPVAAVAAAESASDVTACSSLPGSA
jgi:hypothetical protein